MTYDDQLDVQTDAFWTFDADEDEMREAAQTHHPALQEADT